MSRLALALPGLLLVFTPAIGSGQTLSQRGYVEIRSLIYPEQSPGGDERAAAEGLFRYEATLRPTPWLRVFGTLDARLDSNGQVDRRWTVDWQDRGLMRPALSVRRLSAMVYRGPWTLELGKQFIRWGKADIVSPTDRFAPRDFLVVTDRDFLAVMAAHVSYEKGIDRVSAVWVPRFTPSRVPLLDHRWTVLPAGATGVAVVPRPVSYPERAQYGLRWSRVGTGYDLSLSVFDGFNHLPLYETAFLAGTPLQIAVRPVYPHLRMWGADAAVPTRWFTVKGEAGYFTSHTETSDEYAFYVLELERQAGEWFLVGGYTGEAVTVRRETSSFAPDRGLTGSFLGRAAYTIDPSRSVAVEGVVRDNGDGTWFRAEYSQASGQHWRVWVTANWIQGDPGDFIGQYRHNSHLDVTIRYSF